MRGFFPAMGLGALAGLSLAASAPPPRTAPPESPFVGAAACGECHAARHRVWTSGRHSRMIQPATAQSVLGDFSRGALRLRGDAYTVARKDGAFTITESYVTGETRERRVDYTLGSRRIQHYLSRLEDGRIVVLPPSWDVQRREWFHNLEIVSLEEGGLRKVQVWNSGCVGCHVSEEEKNYDPARAVYDTRWMDFGTSCERCHGPGRAHSDSPAAPMVVATRLPPDRATAVCAQCHSLRDVSAAGFVAGADYFDHFLPVLEYGQKESADPPYWPDGRPRRFSNDALGLWQSACFVKGGATCTTCHTDPHLPDVDKNPQLAPAENKLCLSCHAPIGSRLEAHTRHRPDSAGSSCVECHMPPTVVGIKARMRDHAISVPAPDAAERFGVPDACTTCHQGRDPRWARRALQAWGVTGQSRTLRRAAAFSGARRGDRAAVDALRALAADAGEPPLVRANALGHLRRFDEPRVAAALRAALRDAHPLPRAVAAFTLAEARDDGSGSEPLVAALADPARVVRMAAAFALVNRRVTRLPGENGRRLEEAKRDHLLRADLLLDHAPSQLDRGKLLLLNGDAPAAATSFGAALKLDPALPGARYLLGVSLATAGRDAEALAELRRVPPEDPFFDAARKTEGRLKRP
jgi:hypothetical protein